MVCKALSKDRKYTFYRVYLTCGHPKMKKLMKTASIKYTFCKRFFRHKIEYYQGDKFSLCYDNIINKKMEVLSMKLYEVMSCS